MDRRVSHLYELVSETWGSLCSSLPSHTYYKLSGSPQYGNLCAGIRKLNMQIFCHTLQTGMDSPIISTLHVSLLVCYEVVAVWEGLTIHVTLKWMSSCVNVLELLYITFNIKASIINVTLHLELIRMSLSVIFHFWLLDCRKPINITETIFLDSMYPLVVFYLVSEFESLVANVAWIWKFITVSSHVQCKNLLCEEMLATDITFELPVNTFIELRTCPVPERLPTLTADKSISCGMYFYSYRDFNSFTFCSRSSWGFKSFRICPNFTHIQILDENSGSCHDCHLLT